MINVFDILYEANLVRDLCKIWPSCRVSKIIRDLQGHKYPTLRLFHTFDKRSYKFVFIFFHDGSGQH